MFEVDVKNVTKGRREGKEEDQLRFGVLIQYLLCAVSFKYFQLFACD